MINNYPHRFIRIGWKQSKGDYAKDKQKLQNSKINYKRGSCFPDLQLINSKKIYQ